MRADRINYKYLTTAAFLFLGLADVGCGGDEEHSLAGTPAAPSETTSAPLAGGVHLAWKDNSSDETHFLVERKAGTGTFVLLAKLPVDVAQHHDSTVVSKMAYTYRIAAANDKGKSSYTRENRVTVP